MANEKKPETTAQEGKTQEVKAAKYTATQLDEIAQHALPIYYNLLGGELRGRTESHVAHVAFTRARSFLDTLNEFKKLGAIPELEPPRMAPVTLPNMDKNKQSLKPHQRAVHQYVNEGEPGPERMNEILKVHSLVN